MTEMIKYNITLVFPGSLCDIQPFDEVFFLRHDFWLLAVHNSCKFLLPN